MSDILAFIVKNIGALQPTDYALLIVFVGLASAAIFMAFRCIYAARFKAQNELIDLKQQYLGTLTSHFEIARRERDELRSKLDRTLSRLQALEAAGTGAPNEVDDLRTEALLLLGGKLAALTDRVGLAYRVLFLHYKFLSSAPPIDAVALADRFAAHVETFETKFQEVRKDKTRRSLPQLIKVAESDDASTLASDVIKRFEALIKSMSKPKL